MPENELTTAGEIQQSMQSDMSIDAIQTIGLLFDWNAEITRFYLKRCQQYWITPMRLQSCAAPADMQMLQAEFLQKLTEDYRDHVARLSQIAGPTQQSLDMGAQENYAATLQKAQQDAATIIDQAKAQAERILASAQERAKRAEQLAGTPEERIEKRA